MTFADFRYRYAILAASEASNEDPEKASKAMLDKLTNAQKLMLENFKVGSTKIFFKAGILAKLEELRDEALSGVITKFQSAVRAYLARCHHQQLIKQQVAAYQIQSNIRKWIVLRTWPWYKLYVRVKPLLVGLRSNAEVEALEKRIKEIEDKHQAEYDRSKKLEEELRRRADEYDKLAASLNKEKIEKDKRKGEVEVLQEKLREEEQRYEDLRTKAGDKQRELEKSLKILEDKSATQKHEFENALQRRNQEAEELKRQLLLQQDQNASAAQHRKTLEAANNDLIDQVEVIQTKVNRLEEERKKHMDELVAMEERLGLEKKQKEEAIKGRRKQEAEYKQLLDKFELLQQAHKDSDTDAKRRDAEIAEWRNKAHEDANLITKLQHNLRQLIKRIEDLEEELENERRGKNRAEKLRVDAQTELDLLHEQIAEATGQLSVQIHLNKTRQQEVTDLQRELEKRNFSHESHINDLCSMQWLTLNNLRNLSQQAKFLEHEADRVLDFRNATKNATIARSYSSRDFYKSELDE